MLVGVPKLVDTLEFAPGVRDPSAIDAIEKARQNFVSEVGLLQGFDGYDGAEIAVGIKGNQGSYFFSNEGIAKSALSRRMREGDPYRALRNRLEGRHPMFRRALGTLASPYDDGLQAELLTNARTLRVLDAIYTRITDTNQRRLQAVQRLHLPIDVIGSFPTLDRYLTGGLDDASMIYDEVGERRWGAKIAFGASLASRVVSLYAHNDAMLLGARANIKEQVGPELFRAPKAAFGLARLLGALPGVAPVDKYDSCPDCREPDGSEGIFSLLSDYDPGGALEQA